MAKSTRSTAKKVVAKGKATASAKAVKKSSSATKKAAVKAAPPAKKAVKPAAKPTKVASKPVAKAAKPAAKAVSKTKPVAKAVTKAKPSKPAAVPPSPVKPVAAPATAKVKHASNTIPSAAPAAAKSTPAPKAAPPTAPAAAAPAATPAPISKPTKQVITEENKKNSRKGVITPTASEAGITMEGGRYALAATTNIELPPGYRPSADEEYMNPTHLAFFRYKLREWRDQLVEESKQTIDNLREEVRDIGDEAERATRETENSLELRTRDRYRKLIAKIDKALKRIEEGRYGYCEETDEDIGLERLEARPIATLCLDAQERWEHRQRQMGD
jgi:DnaK suppressor protein